MGRYARDKRPQVKPVEKIQLSGENLTLRAVAAVLLLIIGAGALVYAFQRLFTPEPGWQGLACDGQGGVKAVSTGGLKCLVLAADTQDKTIVVKL